MDSKYTQRSKKKWKASFWYLYQEECVIITNLLYDQVESELRLYRLTGGKVVTKAGQLPNTTVDLIVTGNARLWLVNTGNAHLWLVDSAGGPGDMLWVIGTGAMPALAQGRDCLGSGENKIIKLIGWLFLAKLLNLGIHCGSGWNSFVTLFQTLDVFSEILNCKQFIL